MKILKKYIVSVLVFTFVFVTFHDYVGLHSSVEVLSASYHIDKTLDKADVSDIVHDSMHSFFIAFLIDPIQYEKLSPSLKPLDMQITLISQVLQVPQPPPLS